MIKLQRYQEAIASFNLALGVRDDYALAYYNKAICYALLNQVSSAVDNLQQAIKLNGEYRQRATTDPYFQNIAQDELFYQAIG